MLFRSVEGRRDDLGPRLEEVVALLDAPARVGDRVVGPGGARGDRVRGDAEREALVLVVRLSVFLLGSPGEDSSVTGYGVDL